jgi:hypothetical protein
MPSSYTIEGMRDKVRNLPFFESFLEGKKSVSGKP